VTPLYGADNAPKRAKRPTPGLPIQPESELTARKGKETKVKTRKKAFISFLFLFGTWPFQWVTREKIKKSASIQARLSGCTRGA
jgi:hypothetical protein